MISMPRTLRDEHDPVGCRGELLDEVAAGDRADAAGGEHVDVGCLGELVERAGASTIERTEISARGESLVQGMVGVDGVRTLWTVEDPRVDVADVGRHEAFHPVDRLDTGPGALGAHAGAARGTHPDRRVLLVSSAAVVAVHDSSQVPIIPGPLP
jgi:hypothetical protein